MDFLQFLPANLLPNVAAAIKEFEPTPELTKPKKQKVEGSLAQIAVRSMDNCVGLITFAIAKAWATGKHDFIPRLAQELQIEVDSLKNVQRADREYIQDVLEAMRQQKVSWLYDQKEAEVFLSRPLASDGRDTISRLATAVNAIWELIVPKERELIEFRNLFPTPNEAFKEEARIEIAKFRAKLSSAIQVGDRRFIIATYQDFKDMVKDIPEEERFDRAAAFWYVAHTQKSGTASMVIQAFSEQICQQLAVPQFNELTIVGIQYGCYANSTDWQGKTLPITIEESILHPGRYAVLINGKCFGLLAADSAKPAINSVVNCSLEPFKSSVKATVV